MKESKIEIITPTNILVGIFTFVAGWVNIVGYNLFMNTRPSSMTGRAAEIAESLGRGEFNTFAYLSIVVVLFILGVISSTLITRRYGFNSGLMLVVAILIVDMVLINNNHHLGFFPIILSMAMGAQNGATSLTRISRTTHMSGPSTELGMNLALKNWNAAIFWGIRWIFFPLGGYVAFKFIGILEIYNMKEYITLMVPTVIILFTALVQKKLINIQVL